VHVNCDDFFTFATVANTCGHDYKLYKPHCSSNLRKKLFTDRVINVWNSLPFLVLRTIRTRKRLLYIGYYRLRFLVRFSYHIRIVGIMAYLWQQLYTITG